MKTSVRHELFWICVPLALVIGAGAWISRNQSERRAEERQRESGPLRVRVRSIINMGAYDENRKAGYDYGYRVRADIEGQQSVPLAPGEVWMLRVKSAQIVTGGTAHNARVARLMEPLIDVTIPSADILEVTDVLPQPREAALWLYCDSALENPTLQLQLEVVAGKVIQNRGSTFAKKKFVATGTSVVAPIEKIPLRSYSRFNDKHNIIKGDYGY